MVALRRLEADGEGRHCPRRRLTSHKPACIFNVSGHPVANMIRRAIIPSLVFLGGCGARTLPPEIVSLQALRTDPSLTGPQKDAFYLLAEADDLLVRARGEWDHHSDERARRDALMGQIKMKTALAILEAERSKAKLVTLAIETSAAESEDHEADQALAAVREEHDMQARLASVSAKIADERQSLSRQVESDRKQAANENQKLIDQLADEKRHVEALDALRAAELDLKTADTVLAAQYANVKYAAATKMLQDAHQQFDAANWDQTIARATTARAEAVSALDTARPLYEQAEQVKFTRIRDRALEAAASAITGITTRFERQKDLQKLVLVLPHTFVDHEALLAPEGAKALDAVKELLTAFPTYAVQISGFTDDAGKPAELAASSKARANAVYWALVGRGIDPRRMSIDSPGGAGQVADSGTVAGRAPSVRTEIAILYHVL